LSLEHTDAIYARICGENFNTGDGLDLDIHALSHSYCSILAGQGVALLTAQKLMTHSQPHLTADIYNQSSADDLGATLDQYIGPAEMVGHARTSTTARYTHLTAAHGADALSAVLDGMGQKVGHKNPDRSIRDLGT
jgi:site-specific recombinase XerD